MHNDSELGTFMKVSNGVKGGVPEGDYKNCFAVAHYDLGITGHSEYATPDLGHPVVAIRNQRGIPTLTQFCIENQEIDEVLITMTRKEKQHLVPYEKHTFKKCKVTSVNYGSNGMDSQAVVRFDFEEETIEHCHSGEVIKFKKSDLVKS